MSLEAKRGQVTTRVWDAIARSGVSLSAIPKDQLEKLVGVIADGVLHEFDAMLNEVELPKEVQLARMSVTEPAGGEEQVLWEGRPFLSLVERYVVTNERVRIINGLFSRGYEDIEFIRVKDVDHSQGFTERILGIGDVTLSSADATRPTAVLRNVSEPEKVHEIVRRAMLDARKRYPVVFETEM